MYGIGTQTIETERLILRRISVNDAPFIYYNWTSDPLVTRYLTWDIHENLEVSKQYAMYKEDKYKNEYCFDWIVVLKEINEPIGEIEAVKVLKKDGLVEIGYCYGSKYWNNGYATEAAKAFIDYMFNKVKVDKIVACHISTNPASGRVMVKAGMHYDSTLTGYRIDKNTGEREDLLYYSIDRINQR